MQLPSSQSDNNGITLADFVKILSARKAFIILVILLCVLSAVVVSMRLPKWYKATSVVRVEKPQDPGGIFIRTTTPAHHDPYFIEEQKEILRSKKILVDVLDAFDVKSHLIAAKGWPSLSDEQVYLYFVNKMLSVDSRPGTSLIEISVWTIEDPDLSANIANAIVLQYQKDRTDFALSGQRSTLEKLREQEEAQRVAVQAQKELVSGLRVKYGITDDINSNIPSIDEDSLRQMQRVLVNLEVNHTSAKTRFEKFSEVLEAAGDEGYNLISRDLVPDPNIQNLLQAFLMAELRLVKNQESLGENNPDLISLQKSIEKMKSQLQNLLVGYRNALEIAALEAEASLHQVKTQLDAAKEAYRTNVSSENRREFETEATRLAQLETVLNRTSLEIQQRQIEMVMPKDNIEMLNNAVPASSPDKPNIVLYAFAACVGGTILGVGLAFLGEFLDSSFRSVDDIERALDLPILGVISRNSIVIDKENYNDIESEPYRVVQTNVDLAISGGEADRGKVVAVQSAGPGEGKSTTLHNIAAIMAMTGKKVVVVDSDVRRPSQHKLLGLDAKPGLVDLLSGQATLDDVLRETRVPNLYFIPSGQGSSHFSLSILHNNELDQLIGQLAQRFDRVLLDSPPVIGISDASVLASKADGALLVVQHKRNPQSMSQRAKSIIAKQTTILGVVLNQVPSGGNEDYTYYTSNYHYYGSSHSKSNGSGTRKSRKASRRRMLEEDVEAIKLEDTESRR